MFQTEHPRGTNAIAMIARRPYRCPVPQLYCIQLRNLLLFDVDRTIDQLFMSCRPHVRPALNNVYNLWLHP